MKKWRCSVCGYIHIGEEPPEECPVCGAEKGKFDLVVEEETGNKDAGYSAGKKEGMFDRLVAMMLRNHVHPIAVHTPNGIVPAAVLFLLLAMVLNLSSLEVAAFFNMIFVLLSMPIVLFSGFIEWQKHYKGAQTSVFFTKIGCGAFVLVTLAILVIWRFVDPDVAAPESGTRFIFFFLHVVALAAVGLAGHLGGKLVFGRKR